MTKDVNSPRKWDADYARDTAGWDLGRPTPVFQQLLLRQQFRPGQMIVLGAGRGHDAREFARHGFEVTAVDFASHAIHEMERLDDPQAPIKILRQEAQPREEETTVDPANPHYFDSILFNISHLTPCHPGRSEGSRLCRPRDASLRSA